MATGIQNTTTGPTLVYRMFEALALDLPDPVGDVGCAHARLAAKLADAKRLGLEACGIADSAVQVIDDEAIDDDSESPRMKRDLRRLRAALEAL